jgi:hypothetical protein
VIRTARAEFEAGLDDDLPAAERAARGQRYEQVLHAYALGRISREDLEAHAASLVAFEDALERALKGAAAQLLIDEERARRDEEERMMWPVLWALVGLALVVIIATWCAIAAWGR